MLFNNSFPCPICNENMNSKYFSGRIDFYCQNEHALKIYDYDAHYKWNVYFMCYKHHIKYEVYWYTDGSIKLQIDNNSYYLDGFNIYNLDEYLLFI